MSYLELLQSNNYPKSNSKEESLAILQRYRADLTESEYQAVLDSLCSHAIEGIYFSEEHILLAISNLKNELPVSKIVDRLKAS